MQKFIRLAIMKDGKIAEVKRKKFEVIGKYCGLTLVLHESVDSKDGYTVSEYTTGGEISTCSLFYGNSYNRASVIKSAIDTIKREKGELKLVMKRAKRILKSNHFKFNQ
jgi:hypothetical protein